MANCLPPLFYVIIFNCNYSQWGKFTLQFIRKIPYYDVYGHFILYGIASFLSHLALGGRKIVIYRFFLPLGPFLFAIVTVAEEIMQTHFPTRTFSLLDLSSSLIGIIIFYYLAELWIFIIKQD